MTPPSMHPDQHHPTAHVVRALIADRFPQYARSPVTPVDSDGTVNALFRVGDELVARLPLQGNDIAAVEHQLLREAEACRSVASVVSTPVPRFIGLGGPGSGYPLPWALYRWIEGVPLRSHSRPAVPFAHDLADFVLALRTLPTGGRSFTGSNRGGVLTSFDGWVGECLDRSTGLIDTAAIAALWQQVRRTPHREPDVFTHNDLMPGNLLTDGERLVGVLDLGQAEIADPAVDLQPAWNLLRGNARVAFRERLGVDDEAWDRGRGWSLVQAMGCLWYYVHSNPAMSETARATLQALLDDEG